jgi:hypothetical protein
MSGTDKVDTRNKNSVDQIYATTAETVGIDGGAMLKRMWFDADGGNGNGDGKKPEDQKPPEAKFTQADVDRMLGERAKRADELVTKSLLEGLGLKSLDDLKAVVKKAGDLESAQLSELDKAKKAADKAEADRLAMEASSKAVLAQANERLMKAAVLSEATKADYAFRPEALGDVWLFVDRAGIKPKDGSDEFEGIAEALKAVAKAKPYLVAETTGDGRGTPRAHSNRSGGGQLSVEELAQRKRSEGSYSSL